jgi:hypothetical protein
VNLAEFLRSGAAAAVQWLTAPATLALFAWRRLAEQTADRAGLIACQRIADAEAALNKLALGSEPLFAQIDKEEYLRQTAELATGQAKLALALQDHPYTARRVAALRDWAASDAYAAIWRDLPPGSAISSTASLDPRVRSWAERLGAGTAEAIYEGSAALSRTRDTLRGLAGRLGTGQAPRPSPAAAGADEEPV